MSQQSAGEPALSPNRIAKNRRPDKKLSGRRSLWALECFLQGQLFPQLHTGFYQRPGGGEGLGAQAVGIFHLSLLVGAHPQQPDGALHTQGR